MEKYTNEKFRNRPVVKRKFWLSDFNSNSYREGKILFDELKKLAENKELLKLI